MHKKACGCSIYNTPPLILTQLPHSTLFAFRINPTPPRLTRRGRLVQNQGRGHDDFAFHRHASRSDSGAYAARVSDDSGSVLSRSAAVQVRVPQQLSAGQNTTDGGFVFWSKDSDTGPLLLGDLTNLVLQVSGDLA